MSSVQVSFKRLVAGAVLPAYAHDSDAGLDLVAVSKEGDDYGNIVYGTGLAMAIASGSVGLLFPRSSNSKMDVYLTNSVGVVDSGYRGEVMVKFRPTEEFPAVYSIGDRICQLVVMPYPKVHILETRDLDDTDRGTGGFGSTGN